MYPSGLIMVPTYLAYPTICISRNSSQFSIHLCEGCMHLMEYTWRPRRMAEVRSLQSQLHSVNGRSASGDRKILDAVIVTELAGKCARLIRTIAPRTCRALRSTQTHACLPTVFLDALGTARRGQLPADVPTPPREQKKKHGKGTRTDSQTC